MNNKLYRFLFHPVQAPALAVGVSFGVGYGVSYILRRNRRNKYQNVIPLPASIKRPEPVVIDAEDYKAITEVAPEPNVIELVPEETDEPEIVTQNVFAGDDDDWDYEKEKETRADDQPYVLHKDEFYDEEKGYHQQSCTYYEGDEILADENEAPIYNKDQVIGPLKFGHGSGDPNVFYVRNDKRREEYEILRDPGLYSVEVKGLEIEDNDRVKGLQHSKYPPRFRDD